MTAAQETVTAQREIQAELQDWQDEGVLLVLPLCYVAAGVLIAGLTALPDTFRGGLIILLLLLFPLGVLLLRNASYVAAICLLIAGVMAAIAALIWWEQMPAAIFLLLYPAGLATLFAGVTTGVLVGVACSLLLVAAPGSIIGADTVMRFMAGAQIWAMVGIVWLSRRPLLDAMQWYWASYRRNDLLLEQARDRQMQLNQALEDLAHANVQLTRLNRFAETMRLAAEEARRAKQEFVANVSHELRTPLNMIVGFSQMIVQAPDIYGSNLSPTLLADLEVILRNSQHLSKLIDDVLDLSQIETEHMALTMERTLLKDIVEAAVVATRPLFHSKRLYLNVNVPDLPPLLCDRTRIRQVILNLLSNAGRFTEHGGVTVSAWQEGRDVVVSVADTGPGIANDAVGRLFQPFQQMDGSIRRRYGGSGLGLSISKNFIEMHGGRIWVESREGAGTTFFFRLPIDPPSPAETGFARWFNLNVHFEERTRPYMAPRPVVRPRFVVVETGQVLQRLLVRYLDAIEVVAVQTLEDALHQVSDTPAQALLINDVSVAQRLHVLSNSLQLPYGTPVIVCSVPGAYEAAGDLGAADYLVKPISRERLLGALERLEMKGKTVLIVEDDREAMRLFRRMLSSAGKDYRVLRAADGRQGISLLRAHHPDVVLLDLVMPKMDGFRFLAEKNKDVAVRDVPVLIISARDPAGQVIMSDALAVTLEGGLSMPQLLACIRAITGILTTQGQAGDQVLSARPAG